MGSSHNLAVSLMNKLRVSGVASRTRECERAPNLGGCCRCRRFSLPPFPSFCPRKKSQLVSRRLGDCSGLFSHQIRRRGRELFSVSVVSAAADSALKGSGVRSSDSNSAQARKSKDKVCRRRGRRGRRLSRLRPRSSPPSPPSSERGWDKFREG